MNLKKYSYYFSSILTLLLRVKPVGLVLRYFLRFNPPASEQSIIELPDYRLKLRVRGIMDIWTVKETFLDLFYEKYGTAIEDGWNIIDIGGGIGDFTLFAARGHAKNRVFAFEPFPGSFETLKENIERSGVKNVQIYAEAIWKENGPLAIDASAGEPGQFISRNADAARAASQKVIVPAVTLAEVFQKLGIETCDLMKIDCEGAEYPILFNTPDAVLKRIRRMVMEYHDNAGPSTHRDLVTYLQERGFQVRVSPSFVHSYLGYLYAYQS
jgi:FkbM family methyltransferase